MRSRKPKAKPALVAYLRVSTAEQGTSGLGLQAQREAVRLYARLHDRVIAAELDEVVSTRNDRPVFEAALEMCKQFGHTLTVARLDRLSRDLHTITSLQAAGVDFLAVDNPGASKLTIQILGAIAENERDMISERTKAALARKKEQLAAEGKSLGAPDPLSALAPSILERAQVAEAFRSKLRPRIQKLRGLGLTLQQIADELNDEGFPTPSGSGHWQPGNVARILKTPTGLNLGEIAPETPANDDTDNLPLFAGSKRL